MKTLSTFDFGSSSTYNWDAMLDGGIHVLEQGTDYSCKTDTMVTLLRSRAKARGKVIQASKEEASVTFQAVDASKEQKKAWAEAKKVKAAMQDEGAEGEPAPKKAKGKKAKAEAEAPPTA